MRTLMYATHAGLACAGTADSAASRGRTSADLRRSRLPKSRKKTSKRGSAACTRSTYARYLAVAARARCGRGRRERVFHMRTHAFQVCA
jgi:hypothetical protein